MSYSAGGLIEALDYNHRATAVNSIWGVGAGSNGYGQSTTLSNVTATTSVAAAEWATFVSRLDSIRNHQSGTTSGISSPTAGSVVTYLAAVDTNVSTIQTNKLLFNSTRGTAAPTTLGNPVMSSSTAWTTSSTKEFSVTFTNTNTVRYFFNAGGIITFYLTQSDGTTSKSSDWATFLTNTVGTISFGSNYCARSGTGGDNLTLNTSIGYHNLTTSYQTLFSIGSTSATADYGSNYITVEARVSGSLYGASSNIVNFRCILYDAAGEFENDLVDGTTALYAGITPPSTTYLANTWGFPTAATVTNTQNTLAAPSNIFILAVAGGGAGGAASGSTGSVS